MPPRWLILIVDERIWFGARALPGRGLAEAAGAEDDADIIASTLYIRLDMALFCWHDVELLRKSRAMAALAYFFTASLRPVRDAAPSPYHATRPYQSRASSSRWTPPYPQMMMSRIQDELSLHIIARSQHITADR